MPYKFKTCAISDVGLVRTNNEDVFSEVPEALFFVLADGMGGHKAGEIAARLAVMSLCKWAEEKPTNLSCEETIQSLRQGILSANHLVYNMSTENEKMQGMGTTLCCMMLYDTTLIYAHVGDSRIYRFRNGKLEQLTQDHSLRNELLKRGQLNEKTAIKYPHKNIITRAIGTHPQTEPEIATTAFLPSDLFFLCSDGLTDYVPHIELSSAIESATSLQEIAEKFIILAKQKGGGDNVTVLLVKIEDEH